MRTAAERAAIKSARQAKRIEKQKKREKDNEFLKRIAKIDKEIRYSISRGRYYAYYNSNAFGDYLSEDVAKRIYDYYAERGYKCDIGVCVGVYVKVAWGNEDIDIDRERSYLIKYDW